MVGRFGALMAPRYVRVPAKRAEQLVAVGHAVRVDEADVPKGEQVVVYSEQDFAWAPPTMKAPEKPLEVNDILREFGWTTSPALFDSARSLGFPSPNRTHFESGDGIGRRPRRLAVERRGRAELARADPCVEGRLMAAAAAPGRVTSERFTFRLSAGELAQPEAVCPQRGIYAKRELTRDALYLAGALELREPNDRLLPHRKRRPATSHAG